MEFYFEVKVDPKDAASFAEFMKRSGVFFIKEENCWGYGSDDTRTKPYYENTHAVVFQKIVKYVYGPMFDLLSDFSGKHDRDIQLLIYSVSADLAPCLELYRCSGGRLIQEAGYRMA